MYQVTPAKGKRKRYDEGDQIIAASDDDGHRPRYTDDDANGSSSEESESVECTQGVQQRKKPRLRKGGEKDASYWQRRFNEAASKRRQAEDRANTAEAARHSLQKDMGILKESKKKKKDTLDVFHARMMKEARAFVRYKMGAY